MRYLLFGVWLALLLAVGLAWMHELESGPMTLSAADLAIGADGDCYVQDDGIWHTCTRWLDFGDHVSMRREH